MALTNASSGHGGEQVAAPLGQHRASRYTYKNLADMASASPTCPLRVVAHIDLDAYYAQCEMLRLGTAEDVPLVVQQWKNIIAVNYPARAFGITRMISAQEAKKLCPDLVCQHVPSWKEGETQWAYRPDVFQDMAQQKVSLEPYRIRSREILATLRANLPSLDGGRSACKIEKAGIDEVFVDLSPYIHDLLVKKLYPDILARYLEDGFDELSAALPLPPISESGLDWGATGTDVIDTARPDDGDAAANDARETTVDWDDVVMLEGSRVVQAMRTALYDVLRFRCSAGIASNKMLSKLGSSQHKPNKQTVVRPRAVSHFLASLSSVTKLRGLGGKMGSRVVSAFATESIAELLAIPLVQMQAKLDDQEAGYQIYWMIRGVDTSEVTARTDIKSIISAKSFRPPITSMDKAVRWLRVYVAELKCRLLDEKLSLSLLEAATVATPATVDAAAPPKGMPTLASGGDTKADTLGTTASGTDRAADVAEEELGSGLPNTQDDADGAGRAPRGRHEAMGGEHGGTAGQEHATPASASTAEHLAPTRLPQVIRLHCGQGTGQSWKSRQMRIPQGTPLDEEKLFRLGKQLLEQAARADSLFPCAHLALSVDGFEEPAKGHRSIESFFQPKQGASATAAKDFAAGTTGTPRDGPSGTRNAYSADECDPGDPDSLQETLHAEDPDQEDGETGRKRKRLSMPGLDEDEQSAASGDAGDEPAMARAIGEQAAATSAVATSAAATSAAATSTAASSSPRVEDQTSASVGHDGSRRKRRSDGLPSFFAIPVSRSRGPTPANGDADGNQQPSAAGAAHNGCDRCGRVFDSAVERQEHQDWHVARDLQAQLSMAQPSRAPLEQGSLLPARRRGMASQGARQRAALGPAAAPISSFFQQSTGATAQGGDAQADAAPSGTNPGHGAAASRDIVPVVGSLVCRRCGESFADASAMQVHEDWHFAKDLAGT